MALSSQRCGTRSKTKRIHSGNLFSSSRDDDVITMTNDVSQQKKESLSAFPQMISFDTIIACDDVIMTSPFLGRCIWVRCTRRRQQPTAFCRRGISRSNNRQQVTIDDDVIIAHDDVIGCEGPFQALPWRGVSFVSSSCFSVLIVKQNFLASSSSASAVDSQSDVAEFEEIGLNDDDERKRKAQQQAAAAKR